MPGEVSDEEASRGNEGARGRTWGYRSRPGWEHVKTGVRMKEAGLGGGREDEQVCS